MFNGEQVSFQGLFKRGVMGCQRKKLFLYLIFHSQISKSKRHDRSRVACIWHIMKKRVGLLRVTQHSNGTWGWRWRPCNPPAHSVPAWNIYNGNIFKYQLINRALERGQINLLLQRCWECQSKWDRLRLQKNTTANPIFPFCNKICACNSVGLQAHGWFELGVISVFWWSLFLFCQRGLEDGICRHRGEGGEGVKGM